MHSGIRAHLTLWECHSYMYISTGTKHVSNALFFFSLSAIKCTGLLYCHKPALFCYVHWAHSQLHAGRTPGCISGRVRSHHKLMQLRAIFRGWALSQAFDGNACASALECQHHCAIIYSICTAGLTPPLECILPFALFSAVQNGGAGIVKSDGGAGIVKREERDRLNRMFSFRREGNGWENKTSLSRFTLFTDRCVHGRQNRRSSFCSGRGENLVTTARFRKPLFADMHHCVHAVAGALRKPNIACPRPGVLNGWPVM